MMSMSLVITQLGRQEHTTARGRRRCALGSVRVRGGGVHQRLLRHQAAGQQLHRHARHEPGHHRLRLLHVRADDQRRVHQGLPEDRHPAAVRAAAVLLLPGRRSRSSSGSCSSTRRSAVTCSPPAATPRRRASPASPPTAWCGRSLVASGVDRRLRRRRVLVEGRHLRAEHRPRATCSRRSPPCSSAPRRSRDGRTSGGR